ncbi:MAG: MOSC domain-containing protein [Chloroflexales bacterium]|nr:MOSC domain-containing protein [Chloroflexales bacterium]
MQPVGFVRQIYRYPVKSMAGEPLEQATLGWHGVEGDRRFALRRLGDSSGFPWLTAGKLPALLRYRPRYVDQEETTAKLAVRVVAPDGADLALEGPQLRERIAGAFGADVQAMQLKDGIFDEAPLSLISTATVAGLGQATGVALDVRRFRPNILIDTLDDLPYAEDDWPGAVLLFGERGRAAMSVQMRDPRCAMINLDPDTAAADPRILKGVVRARENCAGVYGATFRTGAIAAGDPVYLLRV